MGDSCRGVPLSWAPRDRPHREQAVEPTKRDASHPLQLAGHAPAADAEQGELLTAERRDDPPLLQPNPAYIIGGNYDVLSHNQAAQEFLPNLDLS